MCEETHSNSMAANRNRRIAERRIGAKDRRELVRYELNKLPRRSGKDRRKLYS